MEGVRAGRVRGTAVVEVVAVVPVGVGALAEAAILGPARQKNMSCMLGSLIIDRAMFKLRV